jgi:hypothetical protein
VLALRSCFFSIRRYFGSQLIHTISWAWKKRFQTSQQLEARDKYTRRGNLHEGGEQGYIYHIQRLQWCSVHLCSTSKSPHDNDYFEVNHQRRTRRREEHQQQGISREVNSCASLLIMSHGTSSHTIPQQNRSVRSWMKTALKDWVPIKNTRSPAQGFPPQHSKSIADIFPS